MVAEVLEAGQHIDEDLRRAVPVPHAEQHLALEVQCIGESGLVVRRLADRLEAWRKGEGSVVNGGERGGLDRPFEQVRGLRVIDGDVQRLLEERQRLPLAAQCRCPLGCATQGEPSLRGQGRRLVARGCCPIGREVVRGERAGELVVTDRLEEPRRSEVARAPVLQREGGVGDLADQRLHEGVLAPLRRPGVDLFDQEVRADERPKPDGEIRLAEPGDRGEAGGREALAEHGGVLDQCALVRLQRVEARRDEGVQRIRNGQLAELADRFEATVLAGLEPPIGNEHADRLDGIQRNALGARNDRADRGLGQARHETREEFAHRRVVERLEVQREKVPPSGAPVLASIE